MICKMTIKYIALLLLPAILAISGCSDDDNKDLNSLNNICKPNTTKECSCGEEKAGNKTCTPDGTKWLECICDNDDENSKNNSVTNNQNNSSTNNQNSNTINNTNIQNSENNDINNTSNANSVTNNSQNSVNTQNNSVNSINNQHIECEDDNSIELPEDIEEIAYDNSIGSVSVDTGFSEWTFAGEEQTYNLLEERKWEAVGFELLHPVTIYGAKVKWTSLSDNKSPAVLGLYNDFGSNGFDFTSSEPITEVKRCLSTEDDNQWITYIFPEPIEITVPGLIFIGHLWETTGDPLFYFDNDYLGDGNCQNYSDCHSALNFPDVDLSVYYNGLSSPFAYDYLVRLLVSPAPATQNEKLFRKNEDFPFGGRVAFGDFDNDGYDDIMSSGPHLYKNNRNGTFADITEEAGLNLVVNSSNGGVWGDFDNDGCLDYFGTGGGKENGELLLKNKCDGTFEDITEISGINDIQTGIDCIDSDIEHSPTEAAAFVDLDNDSYLDIYLANYECQKNGLSYFYKDKIWHNEQNGTFSDWSETRGFSSYKLAGRGVSPIDADKDGDMDIFVSNYRLNRNFYFHNMGQGLFREISNTNGLSGVATQLGFQTTYGHTIGASWFDADNDGDWDLLKANLAHPRFYSFSNLTMLMINDGTGNYTDIRDTAGINYRETHSNPTIIDYDLDGYQDFFITCVYDGRFSELYHNNQDLTFTQVNYESGAVTNNGWGSAASDIDNDGDIDLLATNIFINESAANENNWIQVRALGGVNCNKAGIGAQVEVTASGFTRMGHVSGGSGTSCQDSMFLTFGLAQNSTVDKILVRYPGGTILEFEGPINANQRVWIKENNTISYGFEPNY